MLDKENEKGVIILTKPTVEKFDVSSFNRIFDTIKEFIDIVEEYVDLILGWLPKEALIILGVAIGAMIVIKVIKTHTSLGQEF